MLALPNNMARGCGRTLPIELPEGCPGGGSEVHKTSLLTGITTFEIDYFGDSAGQTGMSNGIATIRFHH